MDMAFVNPDAVLRALAHSLISLSAVRMFPVSARWFHIRQTLRHHQHQWYKYSIPTNRAHPFCMHRSLLQIREMQCPMLTYNNWQAQNLESPFWALQCQKRSQESKQPPQQSRLWFWFSFAYNHAFSFPIGKNSLLSETALYRVCRTKSSKTQKS